MVLQGSKYDHPYIVELLHTYTCLCSQNKSVILAWIPSHVGIGGNEEVDMLAMEALGLNITPLKIPFTDLKRNINIYIRDKWQTLWDEFPKTSYTKYTPFLVWANIIFREQAKRNCTSQGSYWAFIYDSFLLVKR